MTAPLLRRLTPTELPSLRREPVDAVTLAEAAKIVEDVRANGEIALRGYAERLDHLPPWGSLVRGREELQAAVNAIPSDVRALLQRTADRIRRFAEAQRGCLSDLRYLIDGGDAGHDVSPVARAGCYAPGGRFPLVSSALMTVIPARVAGVGEVWVASPRPTPEIMAAAAIAGADALLAAGGAHAIAALAFGAGAVPACDAVVGPGNRWVTAAKQLVAGRVAIDMLAGPSELVALADETADPALVAADLLAQAEHDPDALPVLVVVSNPPPAPPVSRGEGASPLSATRRGVGGEVAPFVDRVEAEMAAQLAALPMAETARAALAHGFAVLAPDLDAAIEVCDRLAPEHLEVMTADAANVAARLSNYGALFLGDGSAEVFGDYGAGPNHVLPTGGAARYAGGLSVFTFLRVRTWLRLDGQENAASLRADAAALGRLEGLIAHARAAERRGK